MKNKSLVYVLLGVSVLVWGWVFYKIYKVVTKSEDSVSLANGRHAAVNYMSSKDSFDLLIDYKDPFFKNTRAGINDEMVSKPIVGVKKKVETKKAIQEPKQTLNWDFIKYTGRIIRQSTGKTLSLVNINGGDYAMEDGKTVQKVLLVKSYTDSILIRFEGIKKYIKRNRI